ncbi:hypothetical protein GCM10025865_02440 [Paraoerskovia sediminicola]|uniref:Uncharacterized protein n=1 Tax=Paraoerskovia sediminicola TaxID=1138587 RepID=A0ABN6X817_9CELL|nr:hypothetical protein [Paraoerskovia sediminicola]BDZ40945.1 hypothetical protein GCM10025865_02440 [Paraoerskovia sediminicola]
MLGRSERESGEHVRQAVESAGWTRADDGPDGSERQSELLDLGTTSATLATVARIEGLRAVLHIGHPLQPSEDLERALLAADRSLVVTGAVAVRADWVWVGPSRDAGGSVVVDEAGMRDCRHVLRAMGAAPRLVPSRAGVAERVDLAGSAGSLVIERSRVPAGFVELVGSARLTEGDPVWYGLVESRAEAAKVEGEAQVWFAFGPRDDHRGSLQETLRVFADVGIDLDHLRSHPSAEGPHVFFASFACPAPTVLDDLVARLDDRGVARRVLAVIPGVTFVPSPQAFRPEWDAAPRAAEARAGR